MTSRLNETEQRLASLEQLASSRLPARETPAEKSCTSSIAEPPRDEASTRQWFSAETVPLMGRTLMVLGGGFVLRALTDYGVLLQGTGTAVGVAYAVLWIVLAERAAARGKRSSATFHGLAASIIAFPLVWEATVKFGILSPMLGACALAAFTALALAVAAARRLRRLAWVVTLGATSTVLALAVATKMLVLFATLLLLLAIATLWLGYLRGWRGPGWLLAVIVDFSMLLMTAMVLFGELPQVSKILNPAYLVCLQLTLVFVYCASVGGRTLWRSENVSAEEIAQTVAAVAIGLGGATLVTNTAGLSGVALGTVSLVLALGCYGTAFAFIDRQLGLRSNFILYTTLALVFTLATIQTLLDNPALTLAFSITGLVTSWLGASRKRATLSLHGAVYATAAAATSGLIAGAANALVGPSVPPPGWISVPVLIALAATAACCWLPVATHGRTWGRFSRVPKLGVLAVFALGAGGIIVTLLAPLLPGVSATETDAGILAVLRTAVLAVASLLLARLGHSERLPESAWLVYPVLLAGGLKLLAEDFPAGRASTLFISLALYGGALILAPRWTKRRG